MPVVQEAPRGWESMYAADIGDTATLTDQGSIYSEKLLPLIEELKQMGFSFRNGLITGRFNGKECLVMIWYHGLAVDDHTVGKLWDRTEVGGGKNTSV